MVLDILAYILFGCIILLLVAATIFEIKHAYFLSDRDRSRKYSKSCMDCVNYKHCTEKNTSFEFSEYGNKWANWCEKFDKRN